MRMNLFLLYFVEIRFESAFHHRKDPKHLKKQVTEFRSWLMYKLDIDHLLWHLRDKGVLNVFEINNIIKVCATDISVFVKGWFDNV